MNITAITKQKLLRLGHKLRRQHWNLINIAILFNVNGKQQAEELCCLNCDIVAIPAFACLIDLLNGELHENKYCIRVLLWRKKTIKINYLQSKFIRNLLLFFFFLLSNSSSKLPYDSFYTLQCNIDVHKINWWVCV